ncbi:hypothetical protein FRC08_008739 [Ceratobasidium sp. 394]|nr:hypothetical protein FRC08_008739 [Ceratobasidium sp. 394]
MLGLTDVGLLILMICLGKVPIGHCWPTISSSVPFGHVSSLVALVSARAYHRHRSLVSPGSDLGEQPTRHLITIRPPTALDTAHFSPQKVFPYPHWEPPASRRHDHNHGNAIVTSTWAMLDSRLAQAQVEHGLAKAAARNAARSPTPEPTTSSGVQRGNALYDTPPRGAQSAKHVSGRRVSRPSSRSSWHRADRARSRSISAKSRATRKYNTAKRAHEQQRGPCNTDGEGNGDDNHDAEGDNIEGDNFDNNGENTRVQTDVNDEPIRPTVHIEVPVPEPRGRAATRAQPQPVIQPRGRGRAARNLERSPTPGSTDVEDLPIVSGNTPVGSQYTYVYETVDHATLVRIAEKKVPGGANLSTWSTKDLLAAIQVYDSDQATSVAAERRPTSIEFLPGAPITVGGQAHSKVSAARNGNTASRVAAIRVVTQQAGDESEDEAVERQTAAATAARILLAKAQSASGPARGTQPPPPSRQSTATTVLETQPSREPTAATLLEMEPDVRPSDSASLGGSRNGGSQRPLPPLPNIFSPVGGPVHARLRAKAIERAFPGDLFARLEDDEHDPRNKPDASNRAHCASNRPGTPTPTERTQRSGRTYGRNRTHLASALDMLADIAEAATPAPHPNSPSLDPAEMIRRERARAILEKARIEAESRSRVRPHRHVAQPSQTAPAPTRGSSSASTGASQQRQQQGRLDPVLAARSDMLAFNQEVQERNVESFIESVTCQHRRKGPCGPVEPRKLTALLADDEELLAQAEALAQSSTPKSNRRRRHNCKKKPLACDTTGIARQILVLAKIHLFAFALVEGIYQTRATFLQWAALIHEETWCMELPDVEYEAATTSEQEVMVNYLATLRGKVKERLQPIIAFHHGLNHRVTNQQEIQNNLDAYHLAWPNTFHCTSYSPRRGHYENPEIAHLIGATLFYSPSAVGLQFPDYFDEMPLTVVAFILAVWQFCLEEWSNGWFESRDLGMSHMLNKYEAHLAGLKELHAVAPRRLHGLQDQWSTYAKEYSGASFIRKAGTQAVTLSSELRPDTPEPATHEEDQYDTDAEESRLLEAARIASLEQLIHDNRTLKDVDSRAGSPAFDLDGLHVATPHTIRSHSPTPPPAVEYNEEGRLTARSKGKGRAN